RFDKVGAAKRIDRIDDTALAGDYLLGAQRDQYSLLCRERECFIQGVGMERVGTAEHGRQGLNCRTNDVVVGLLGCERDACRLRVAAHHPGAGVLSTVALAHKLCPQATPGAELGNLLEEVVVYVEEEG